MMPCPRCGGPQIQLFSSVACKAECDLRATTSEALRLWNTCDATWVTFVGAIHTFPLLVAAGVPAERIPVSKSLGVDLLVDGDPTKLMTVSREVRPVPGTEHLWQLQAWADDFARSVTRQVRYWVSICTDDPFALVHRYGGRWTTAYEALGHRP